ncbi:MAG: ATP synthase subunit I [Bacteroidia bacterium]
MNDIVYMAAAFVCGLVLGTLYFGGLWLTVKKAVTSKIPAIWFLTSFLFRVGVTLIGFYYISQNNWQRLLICLVGFVAARYIVLRLTKPNEEKQVLLEREVRHES